VSPRSVVVTGASTGIGRATVLELVSAGFHVFGTVRRETDAEGLRRQFPEVVTPLIMDLLDEDSVRAVGEVVNDTGPLFGLVNNAGAALPGPLETIPLEVFRRQIEINLTAQLLVTQVMLPALHRSAEETDARIIMIGSIGGRLSGPMLGGYGAAKHGLVGLSSSLRAELAPSNADLELRSRRRRSAPSYAAPNSESKQDGNAALPRRVRPQHGAARVESLTSALSYRSLQWHVSGSNRRDSCPGTAGGNPPRSRSRLQGRSRW